MPNTPEPSLSRTAAHAWLKLPRIRHVALAMLVFAIAWGVLAHEIGRVAHWADENDYLITSRYFHILFVARDLANPEWDDSYWTRTQPMVTRYLIGGWLWARGYDLYDMPRRYDLTNSFAENQRKGRVPDAALLTDARLALLPFAAGTIMLLYLLGAALSGATTGLVAAGVALASPLLREHIVRAMPEAPLACFLLLALLVGVLGGQRGRRGRLPTGWAIGLGLAAGLAFATKLTGVLSLVVIGGAGLLAGAVAAGAASTFGTRLRRGVRAGQGWALAAMVALATWTAVNPHLYPNPICHTAHLFEERLDDEQTRQREVPQLAIRDPLRRPGPTLDRSLVSGMLAGSYGAPIEAVLAAIGLTALLARLWRARGRTSAAWADGLVLLTTLVYFAGVSAGLHMVYDRYFVPTVLLGALLDGVGAQAFTAAVTRRVGLRWGAPRPRGAR